MGKAPTLAGAMTPFPHSIAVNALLADAHAMMEAHDIHHLPVTDAERIVGVVSRADIVLAQSVGSAGTEVAALIRSEPYVVDIRTSLRDVAMGMVARRIDSVVVTRRGKLAGILTHTDVCRVLADVIAREKQPSDDVA